MKRGGIADLQCRHVSHNHGTPEQHIFEAARERHAASYPLVDVQSPFEGSERFVNPSQLHQTHGEFPDLVQQVSIRMKAICQSRLGEGWDLEALFRRRVPQNIHGPGGAPNGLLESKIMLHVLHTGSCAARNRIIYVWSNYSSTPT